MAVTIGNHEMPDLSDGAITSMEFDGYMNLPNNGPIYASFDRLNGDLRESNFDNGKTYSFNYGDAHILVIDTEVYCDGTTTCSEYDQTNAQILNDWVDRDLTNNTKEWTIVMLHRGPYSLSYDTYSVRNNLAPIFDEHGVDLVLAGHDHQYSRAIYNDGDLIQFSSSNPYTYGTLNLDSALTDDINFNNYSSSLGVTYLTSNTVATKFYGGDKSSGIEVNYEFQDEYPVVPVITVSEDGIQVISYVVIKDSNLSIIPTSVDILEQFLIVK